MLIFTLLVAIYTSGRGSQVTCHYFKPISTRVQNKMSALNNRTDSVRNKTAFGRNIKYDGHNGDPAPPAAMPWLLPVLVAVLMVAFLMISFALHHKRFLQQQRRVTQYYTLRYHRVAGPILNTSMWEDELAEISSENIAEQSEKLNRLAKSFSFKYKLGRNNTWSPQILKCKLGGYFNSKRRSELDKKSEDFLQVLDQKLVNEGKQSSNFKRSSSLLEQSSLTSSEILSLADLSGLTRSYSCRSRAVGVTTMTGTLAMAKYDRETPILSVFNNACYANQAEFPRKFSQNVFTALSDTSRYEPDVCDSFHNSRPHKRSQPRLARYLEDDACCLATSMTDDICHASQYTCSHCSRQYGSDEVFEALQSPEEAEPYPDVLSSIAGHAQRVPEQPSQQVHNRCKCIQTSRDARNIMRVNQITANYFNSNEDATNYSTSGISHPGTVALFREALEGSVTDSASIFSSIELQMNSTQTSATTSTTTA